jgi:glycosyltransferase involved in cell wall biosynthesis
MLQLSLFVLLAYLFVILTLYFGFDKVPTLHLKDRNPANKFSIVIPFRNEAKQLPDLLKSICQLNYPNSHFEILFVDDASEDSSADVIHNFFHTHNKQIDYHILDNQGFSGSPKKDALNLAVKQAKHPYIVTTDADVSLPSYWLDAFDECIQEHHPDFIVAPVQLHKINSFLHRFQQLEFLSLQASTIGGFGINKPFMCNGANLCYKKSVFLKISAYDSNNHIASGDDVFLLEAMVKKRPEHIIYLKNELSIVKTKALNTWESVIQQRQRWAAKSSAYTLWVGKLVGIIVFLMNLTIASLPVLVLLQQIRLHSALMLLIAKISADFLLIFQSGKFFDQREALRAFLPSSIIYPFFSTFIVFKSLLGSYQWKGRSYKA